MIRSLVKTRSLVQLLAMCLLSVGILWQLARCGLLDLVLIKSAFLHSKVWIGMSVCAVGTASLLAGIRFHRLLAFFSVQASFKDALISGLVSQALGQWMPGSMAVGEVLRFGLMTSLAPRRNPVGPGLSATGVKSRIGMASLLDRFLGFGVMLSLGGLAALLVQGGDKRASPAVPLLSTISLALGTAILITPLLSGSVMRRLLAFFQKSRAEKTTPSAGSSLRRNNVIPRTMRWLRMMIETLGTSTTRRSWAVIPLLISAGIAIINPLSFYLSALAIGRPIPFLIILAAAPFTYIAVFLPLGFAGYGGQQLVVAGVFALLGVSPETVVATSLLQTTIVLAVQTFLGGAGAVLSLDRLRAIIKSL
jgi:uncharacterized protein (TIRG00374 family)